MCWAMAWPCAGAEDQAAQDQEVEGALEQVDLDVVSVIV